MDTASLTQLIDQINHQSNIHESLTQRILEIEALAEVIVAIDFLSFSKNTVHHYLIVMSNVVAQSKELSEEIADLLIKLKSLACKIPIPE